MSQMNDSDFGFIGQLAHWLIEKGGDVLPNAHPIFTSA
jgi:hypothetical protein